MDTMAALFMFLSSLVCGMGIGMIVMDGLWRAKTVKAGVAEYVVDEDGKPEWQFK